MMNKILLFLYLLLPVSLLAQGINYQGIARISSGVVASQSITVNIELLELFGTTVFQESHTPTTNAYGVFNIGIGTVNSTGFRTINWVNVRKIRSTFSYNGQNIVTTDDLKSVPFAQLAYTATTAEVANSVVNATGSQSVLYLSPKHNFVGPVSISGSQTSSTFDYTFYGRSSRSNVFIETGPDGCECMVLPDGSIGSRNGTGDFSLQVSHDIVATEFYATSDKRIKKDINQTNSMQDLNFLSQLKIQNYKYKDFIQKGLKSKKGFIAQEVEQVFPEAVTKHTDFIPNIYQIGKNIKTNDTEQTLTITVDSLDDLKVGDKIRLIAKAQNEVEVTAVAGTTFTVKGWTEKETKDVFVYGKQVNDFRVVDYDRIFTLNVSATQALIQEVDGLKAQIRALEAQNQALKKSNLGLTKKFDSLDSRLSQLEKTAEKAATPTPVNGQGSKTKPKR